MVSTISLTARSGVCSEEATLVISEWVQAATSLTLGERCISMTERGQVKVDLMPGVRNASSRSTRAMAVSYSIGFGGV